MVPFNHHFLQLPATAASTAPASSSSAALLPPHFFAPYSSSSSSATLPSSQFFAALPLYSSFFSPAAAPSSSSSSAEQQAIQALTAFKATHSFTRKDAETLMERCMSDFNKRSWIRDDAIKDERKSHTYEDYVCEPYENVCTKIRLNEPLTASEIYSFMSLVDAYVNVLSTGGTLKRVGKIPPDVIQGIMGDAQQIQIKLFLEKLVEIENYILSKGETRISDYFRDKFIPSRFYAIQLDGRAINYHLITGLPNATTTWKVVDAIDAYQFV